MFPTQNGSGPKKASWSDPITSNTSFYCHRGMFQCTKAVLAHAEPVLTKIFHDGAPAHPSRSPGEAAHAAKVAVKCQGYRLVLTGHSMGAGVAVILGALLRPQFPDLAVWAFSPPGGFVSPEVGRRDGGQTNKGRRKLGSWVAVPASPRSSSLAPPPSLAPFAWALAGL